VRKMILDTHVHLDCHNEKIPEDEKVITIGYKNDANVLLPKLSDNVPFTLGIAPQVAMEETFKKDHEWLNNIKRLINHERCIGIGEIGLDNKWATTEEHRKRQKLWFEEQLTIAEQNKKPIVIHSRKAEQEIIDILNKWEGNAVFHSFGGKPATAEEIIDHGWMIGINPLKSKEKKKVIKMGIENLIIETDLPYIGKTFKDINQSIERIKEVTDMKTADIIKVTFDNGIRVFNLRGD